MKLILKFISLSTIAIFCVLFLGYNSFSNLDQYANMNDNLTKLRDVTKSYSERNTVINSIYTNVWHALYLNTKGDSTGIKNITNNISNLSVADYYKQDANVLLNNTDSNFLNYLNQAKQIIQNINTPNLDDFETCYNKVLAENKSLYEQNSNRYNDIKKLGNKSLAEYRSDAITITIFSLILIGLVLLFSYANIFNPLSKIISIMANNNHTEMPFLSRTDEIGDIARALDLLRSTSIAKEKLEEQSKNQATKTETERHNSMLSLYNNFETKVKSIVDMVASAVEKMNSASQLLGKLANLTQKETSSLSSTSSQTKTNIEEMSKATTEFSSVVNEISAQVTNSLEYARRAAEQADQVNNVVLDLDTKANAVTSIIDIINNITSQIDLLALNATIEAARAGEMGKGFAVVANEIKALATQTSKATEQINFQISGIQSSTNKAVASIQEITESVKTINKNSESINSAVKKQNATGSIISSGMDKVVSTFNSVSTGVEKVAESSNQYGNTATEIVSTAEDLLKQSNSLQTEVDKFLSSLKLT